MTGRRTIGGFLLASFSLAFLLSALSMTNAFAAVVNSNIAPNPDNSSPFGAHVFFMRKDRLWGDNSDLSLKAYYPANMSSTDWTNATIKIRPGGSNVNDTWVCQRDAGSLSGLTPQQRDDYLDHYVKVKLTSSEWSDEYDISYDKLCTGGQQDHNNQPGTDSRNIFFGTYRLPGRVVPQTPDRWTNRHVVDVNIHYNSRVPTNTNNTGNTLRFDLRGNTQDMKIGMKGELRNDDQDNYYAFPIISDAQYQTGSNPFSIKIPFGLSCNVNSNTRARVGLYDADNGSIYWASTDVSFRVREKQTGNYVRFVGGSERRGYLTNNDTVFTPRDGESNFASVSADFDPDINYVMEIQGIIPRNIIDIHVPGDTIYGDIGCRWRMDGTSSVSTDTASPGDQVTFTHTAKNVGGFPTDNNIDIAAKWGKQGVRTDESNVYASQAIVDSVTPSNPINDKRYDPDQERTITDKITIPANAQDGDLYCQFLRINHRSSSSPGAFDTNDACVRVSRTPPTDAPPRYVNIAPSVNAPYDEEVGNQVRFNGVVTVTGSPSLAAKEWGYGEKAVQLPAQRVQATITSDGTNWSRTRTQYVCPPGYTPSGAQTSPTTCTYTYVWYTWEPAIRGSDGNYSCHSYSGFTGTTSGTGASKLCQVKHTQTYTTASVAQYSYFCTSNNSYTGWTSSTTSTCPKYYQCPNGAAGSGWGGATCEAWQCQYPSAVVLGPNPPICEARCDGGRGNWWAQFSYGQYRDQGDLNCYVQPKFQLTCRWLDAPDFATITINGDGRYDCSSTLKTGEILGAQLCATLRPLMPTAWTSTYAPGWAMDHYEARWSWRISPPTATTCTKITGRPYVKAYTGDVMVGGGVAWGNSGVCTPNSTATIKTFSKDGNLGAGTQYAAFAQGFIDRFVSGQYNPYSATPNVGSPPTALTFANNAGGSGYGGGFGNTGPCINYVGKLPSDAQQLTGNVTLPVQSEKNLGTGQKIVKHVVGNVFINDNITYSGANSNGVWPSSDKIPLFQLVVEGNIYISSSVVQLDGLYAAIPNAAGQGGVIYTCATGIGSVPSDTFGACKQQLAVNGAFAARQIAFLRDCSSLKWSTSYEPPVYQGQTDNQLCSISNHAAEVFNYTPEQWIRGSAGSPPNKYDAISSMPPVL